MRLSHLGTPGNVPAAPPSHSLCLFYFYTPGRAASVTAAHSRRTSLAADASVFMFGCELKSPNLRSSVSDFSPVAVTIFLFFTISSEDGPEMHMRTAGPPAWIGAHTHTHIPAVQNAGCSRDWLNKHDRTPQKDFQSSVNGDVAQGAV